jgi:hypothetical protein
MDSGRRNTGFPSNNIKGSDWRYNAGCGGSGAGSCFLPANFSYMYWEIKVNPFSSHNSKLLLHNDGFRPFTDSPTGVCTHNDGSPMGFDVLLLHNEPVATLDRSLATGIISVPSSITFPYELEFDAPNIPQPTDPSYERKIWVALDLKQTGLMVNGLPQKTEIMQTVKLNWEGQP